MSSVVPVTVLSGFLGSGKTTLLNHLLQGDHGLKVAVVVNEFGSVAIDAALVSGGEQFVELANGCICCALNKELEVLLRELMERGGFDHLVLETTGLADPLPVAWTFAREGLDTFFRIDALITVIDAVHLDRALNESPMARVQIDRGDLLVLNKMDLAGDGLPETEQKIREINGHAPIVRVHHGAVPWSLLLNVDPPRGHKPDYLKHQHQPETGFSTFSYTTPGILSDEGLDNFLDALGTRVFRVKGLVRTDERPGWTLINQVSGRTDIRSFVPTKTPDKSALVFIGADLDEAGIRANLNNLLVDVRPDP